MRNTWSLLAFLVLLSLGAASCGGDDGVRPKNPYRSLDISQPKDNVLFNLQKAVTGTDLAHYDELLNDAFRFYFSGADQSSGDWTVGASWDRSREMAASANMFDPGYAAGYVDPVTAIALTITYAPGDSEWTEVAPGDQEQYPGETWYRKSVTYNLAVKCGSITMIGIDRPATFTVRGSPREVGAAWRIVEWRDDAIEETGVPSSAFGGGGMTEECTWGATKALYCGEACRYRDLAHKDNTLYNLARAYNDRDLDEVDVVLDSGLVFHFSAKDISEHGVPIESWERASEIAATRNLFDPAFSSPNADPAEYIYVQLHYAAGDDHWTEVTPDDQANDPGEIWYAKDMTYNISVGTASRIITGRYMPARIMVRRANENGEDSWQIIRWLDDPEALQPGASPLGPAGVEDTTWGLIKYLYSYTPPPLTSP